MAQQAFFSIITVTLNNLAGLKRTGISVAAQPADLYEWIVIDGGSVDGTCEHLAGTSARWSSLPDRGIYDAMNMGIEKALGQYLIFMNAGDEFAQPGVLKGLEQAIQSADMLPDFIYGDSYEMLPSGQVHMKTARGHERAAFGMFTHHQAMVYHCAVLKDLRYDLRYKIAADYDLTLRVLRAAAPRKILRYPGAVCKFEAGGISQQNALAGRFEQFEIRKNLATAPRWKNNFIYSVQQLNWNFRHCFPALYWFLKR